MNSNSIAYLRTHSVYGFLESLLTVDDLVKTASTNQVQVLGLTDHRFLTGSIEFYEACKNYDIKPILGLEIDLVFENVTGYLTLLAKDRSGWSNLSHLSYLMLYDESILDFKTLKSHRSGLICIAGDHRGILRKIITRSPEAHKSTSCYLGHLRSIFTEDCFIEIQRYSNGPLKFEKDILKLAQQHNIPTIATQNIFYRDPSEQARFRTLSAIKHNTNIHGLIKDQLPPGSAHLPKPEDFIYRFNDIPETISNLNAINDRCNLDLPLGQTHYPEFATPNGESQSEFLQTKAYAGAKKLYKNLTPEITQRLNDELEVISTMGYEPIFLIVEDIINHARKLGIPTSSRGSAASSLVAHCLNITSPDPIALNLYFERFLNPARKKPPDIDTDIASHRRDEIIEYVFKTYGTDRVAMVGTINRYRPKSAFSDVAKAYGLTLETIRQLSKKLPSSFHAKSDTDHPDPFSALYREDSIPILKDIINDARSILDIPRHLSVHPGGMIIAPFPITELIPLAHSSSLGVSHTQYDLNSIEKLGMVKIDLLGIRGLTVLGEVANKIQSWRSSEYNDGLSVLENIPINDAATSDTISNAKTIGCFQIESPGMRATLREINATKMEDIMAALALYRPGPLRGGLRDAFVRRFRGDEPVSHIHGSLKALLDNTLGVILYQEQVLRIAHELGGLSIAEADILRRAMSHFAPGGVMDTLREHFIEGAGHRHQVPQETANQIWEMMAAFAGYGFPKAHAASYAQLAWNSAWCKTHFPAEFMSAVLGFGGGYYSQRVYLMEAQRLGLPINPPHINHSTYRFRVTYPKGKPALYMGLNQVRELSHRTIQKILDNQPFQTLEDFLIRVDPYHKEAKHLIMCGALEGLTSIPQALARLDQQRPPGQLQLFSASKITDNWSPEKLQKAQQEILGVSLANSPFEQFADQINSAGAVSTFEAQTLIGEKIIIAGMRQSLRRFRSRDNQIMCSLVLEDLEGSLQVLIPPMLYRFHQIALREPGPFLIEGVIEFSKDRQQNRMIAKNIALLGQS